MATLNLSYEDLASVICLASHLANADGDVSEVEMEAIVKAIIDQYNFEGKADLLNEYINDGTKMDPQEALRRIAAFGPVEKQWTSNFFVKTIVSDGNLTESEKSLYWDIMDKCGLPDHNLESDNTAAAPEDDRQLKFQTCVVVEYTRVQGDILDGTVKFPQFERKGAAAMRSDLFGWFGLDSLQFERVSDVLDSMNEHLGMKAGWKLIMVYGKAEQWASPKINQVGTYVAGEDVYGPVFFLLENDKKELMGFNYKSFIKTLLDMFNGMGDSIMVSGEHNPELSRRYLITALTKLNSLETI